MTSHMTEYYTELTLPLFGGAGSFAAIVEWRVRADGSIELVSMWPRWVQRATISLRDLDVAHRDDLIERVKNASPYWKREKENANDKA